MAPGAPAVAAAQTPSSSIKDGDFVALSPAYKDVDDAKDGPLQPGLYGVVVKGGGSQRVRVGSGWGAGGVEVPPGCVNCLYRYPGFRTGPSTC